MLLQQLIHRIPSPEEKMNPRMRNTIFIILLTLFTSTVGATTIKIYTQQDFDLLSTNIMKAIKQGKKDISVDIETKELRFSDNQISITGIKRRDVSISIHGNGVRIMSRGISVKEVKSPTFMYLRNGDYYNPWTEFQQLQDTISIIDEALHLCSINTPSKNKEDLHPQNKYINYTCWYTSRTSSVTYISKNRIEFDGGEWAVPQQGNFFNVNMDYSYAKVFPRYRLFGVKAVPNKLYECAASTLLKIAFCDFQSFSIDNINVTGSSNNGALILIDSSKADSISISNSTFRCIGGTILLDRKSSNVCFSGNRVDTFIGYGIESEVGSAGSKVHDNAFSNCTLGMEMGFAIKMRSDNFVVRNNTISDFCYGGIGVGIYAKTKTDKKCTGIVSDNELYYTDTFLSNLSQHTLMDTGAIYTWTRTDGVTISNNYIHDIAGIKSNNGIFCDDGAKGITLSGNRIERIHGGYDINLRWCETYKADVPDHNSGNRIFNNQTTGKVRFETQRP